MPSEVLTQHNNNQRTGANQAETLLTVEGVRSGFHKLFEVRVDPPEEGGPVAWKSQIVAQPLFAADIPWSDGTTRDVLIVCTMHGTVYAYDAGRDCAVLWAVWLGPPVLDFVGPSGAIDDKKDIWGTNPEWGVLSTPVIDSVLKRVYVVMWNGANGGTYRLYALNLLTGAPIKPGVPYVTMAGSVPLTGAAGQLVVFNPAFQKQRSGLLLLKRADLPANQRASVGVEGTLYIAFGASIEVWPWTYHGWVFAYDIDGGGFSQRAVWCSTPNGQKGGVWQAGAGLAADDKGNIYIMMGDGDFDQTKHNYGESFVKLSCKDLSVLSFFTPWNWRALDDADADLGSSGPVFIPGTKYVVGAGKDGKLYSLDSNNLGGVAVNRNNTIDEVQATFDVRGGPTNVTHHVHGSPVYFKPLNRLYLWGENDVLKAFTINPVTGKLSSSPVASGIVLAPDGMPGGMLSLSANGATQAIVWAALPLDGDANKVMAVEGVLRAFDASTVQQIWSSSHKAEDRLGNFAKFAPPTVAKGRVYAATYEGKIVVYGL
jgi:outer membrane protein assembly factor BamB